MGVPCSAGQIAWDEAFIVVGTPRRVAQSICAQSREVLEHSQSSSESGPRLDCYSREPSGVVGVEDKGGMDGCGRWKKERSR